MSASSKKKLRKEQNAAAMTEKQQAQQKEAKKLKIYTVSFVAVLALIVVAALVVGGVTAIKNGGILQRMTDAVTIGDTTLSNAELNYYYIAQIKNDYNNWLNSYGESTQLFVQWMMGLDIAKPLDDQIYDAETGETFADYYKDRAIESAKNVYAIYNAAKAAGETLTEDQEAELDLSMETLEFYAQYSSTTPEGYLKSLYGSGATLENYRNYLEVNTLATSYAQKYHDGIEITDKDIDTRNKEDYDEFSAFDYAVFLVDVDDFLPCNGTDVASDHKHSDDEYAAARKAAEETANTLAASGATTMEQLDAAFRGHRSGRDILREHRSCNHLLQAFPSYIHRGCG